MVNPAIKIDQPFFAEYQGTVWLHVEVEVPDRDTGLPRRLFHSRQFELATMTEQGLLELLRHVHYGIFTHEFCEAWHVDGVRVEDPHRWDEPVREGVKRMAKKNKPKKPTKPKGGY